MRAGTSARSAPAVRAPTRRRCSPPSRWWAPPRPRAHRAPAAARAAAVAPARIERKQLDTGAAFRHDGAVASTPAPIRFRPMPLPELLDELFRLYRRHFSVIAGISLLLVIPGLLTSLLSGSYRTNPIGLLVQYVLSGGGAA